MNIVLAGGAAAPWLTGLLHDVYGTYTLAFAIGILVNGLSALAIWMRGRGRSGRSPAACT